MSAKMNLAEATAALSKKDAEKSLLLEEIQKLEDLQTEGIVAFLNGTIYGLKDIPENKVPSFTYQHFTADATEHTSEHADLSIGEAVRVRLNEKGGKLKIVCKLVPVPAEGEATTDALAEELQYVAHIDLNEVPEDTEMRTEITANLVGADGEPRDDVLNAVALNLKASVDDVASMIVRKTVELQQLHGEFEQISAAVQEAKKKPAASSSSKASGGKGKVGGKKTVSKRKVVDSSASRGQETAAGGDEGEDNATTSAASSGFSGWLPTSIDSVRESVMGAAEYAFERRAYVLFPVVAAIFHFYGDYASV